MQVKIQGLVINCGGIYEARVRYWYDTGMSLRQNPRKIGYWYSWGASIKNMFSIISIKELNPTIRKPYAKKNNDLIKNPSHNSQFNEKLR